MNKLEAVCIEILRKSKPEMSDIRLGYMVYICDWISALTTSKQITRKDYKYFFGSIENDIIQYIENSMYFKIIRKKSNNAVDTKIIEINEANVDNIDILSNREKEVIDVVLSKFNSLYFNEIKNYVLSTEPLTEEEIFHILDLENTAKKITP